MNLSLKPLTLRLSGILDAAVMGGITNYEKVSVRRKSLAHLATIIRMLYLTMRVLEERTVFEGTSLCSQAFFSSEYISAHPEDALQLERLRNLIAEQVPLLGLGISLHCARAPPLLSQLHSHLEKCYNDMKTHIEERYGKRVRRRPIKSYFIARTNSSIDYVAQMRRSEYFARILYTCWNNRYVSKVGTLSNNYSRVTYEVRLRALEILVTVINEIWEVLRQKFIPDLTLTFVENIRRSAFSVWAGKHCHR